MGAYAQHGIMLYKPIFPPTCPLINAKMMLTPAAAMLLAGPHVWIQVTWVDLMFALLICVQRLP